MAIMALLVATACGPSADLTAPGGSPIVTAAPSVAGPPTSGTTPPTGSTSMSPSASLPPATAAGPLAIVPPAGGSDSARAEGVLDLGGPCATLRSPGEVALLLWPADRVTWNADSATVSFANAGGQVATIPGGARVAVGGSGEPLDETGLTRDGWIEQTEWVHPPRPNCSFDAFWWVGSIEPAG